MLLRLLKDLGLTGRRSSDALSGKPSSARARAKALIAAGDLRSAIPELQRHLEGTPHDVDALNDLGCCLSHIGDTPAAWRIFELALRIDESHLASTLNYAKMLADGRRSTEALALIRRALILRPDHPLVDSALASVDFWRGDVAHAVKHAQRAWSRISSDLRMGNTLLFYCAYSDDDEGLLAALHRFWGEVIPPLPPLEAEGEAASDMPRLPPKSPGRVRVGYWSPDFREHSIRYFFRPILENHDRNQFETVVYHDSSVTDTQTELIEMAAEHFCPVSQLSDDQLRRTMRAHELDVLVELAGHTGNNRLNLLQDRLATLQLTALGYPATTGLASIDGKILDRHIVDKESPHYYTEAPVALAGSFWCFDPLEEVAIDKVLPADRNGFVTFACIGNIAKANARIYRCWASILEQVPGSRLVLRSVSFTDFEAARHTLHNLRSCGVPTDRVLLEEPVWPPKALLESFREIDIVLDTYPFNGGTTSAFAIHMGVPVVCWSGKSLTSRMGKSMMQSVGMPNWVASDAEGYIRIAAKNALDLEDVRRFRKGARDILRQCSLGNGSLYTRELEAAYLDLLAGKPEGAQSRPRHQVASLPRESVIRSAHWALSAGDVLGARRMVDYCLREYPNLGSAYSLEATLIAAAGSIEDAARYLSGKAENLGPADASKAMLSVASYWLLCGSASEAAKSLEVAGLPDSASVAEKLQWRLLRASIAAQQGDNPCHSESSLAASQTSAPRNVRARFVIPCDDETEFRQLETQIRNLLAATPDNLAIHVIRCEEGQRSPAYQESISHTSADIVVWVQRNIRLANCGVIRDLFVALFDCDVVGVSGATAWSELNWHDSPNHTRAGCLIVPTGKEHARYEVQVHGHPATGRALHQGMVILDGSFIAFRPDRLPPGAVDWLDPLLEEGGTLLEEAFTHRCHRAGLRLAAHCSMGVVFDWRSTPASRHDGAARMRLVESLGIPAPQAPRDPPEVISAPVPSMETGLVVQRALFPQPE